MKPKVLFKDESLERQILKWTEKAIESLEPVPIPFQEVTGLEWNDDNWAKFDTKREFLLHQYREMIDGDRININGTSWKIDMIDQLPLDNEEKIEKYLQLSDKARAAIKSNSVQYDLIIYSKGRFRLNKKLLEERCSVIATTKEQLDRWNLIHGILENVLHLQKLGVDVTNMERITLSSYLGPFFIKPSQLDKKDICELRDIKRIAQICTSKETEQKMQRDRERRERNG